MEDTLWFTAAGLITFALLFKLLLLRNPARPQSLTVLQEMFPSVGTETLQSTLQNCNWNLEAAIDLLSAQSTERPVVRREATPVPFRSVSGFSSELAGQGWSEDAGERQRILAAKKRMLIEGARKGRLLD